MIPPMQSRSTPQRPAEFEAIARRLHAAWLDASDPTQADRLLAELAVPGPVALRARFHFLTDAPSLSQADLELSLDHWLAQLKLETQGDAALIANDPVAAAESFADLVPATPARHLADRLARIHGLIGLGDIARQGDDIEEALPRYEQALNEAGEIGHRFGEVRALVPLAYLALTSASASEAQELFERAEQIAVDLDERLYLANALIGKGEAQQRLREHDGARKTLRRALEVAEQLHSNVAIGNAAQRLADLDLRSGERDRVPDLLAQAADAFERGGVAIGAATAADSLADLLLSNAQIPEAVEQYRRAFDLSQSAGYRRGQAHALTGFARCAEAVDKFDEAEALQERALEIYESLDDLIGRTSARSGLARTASAQANDTAAIDHWLTVIEGIEEMRALRDRLDLQEEYRLRFSESYSAALQAAVDARDRHAFVTVFESLAGRRLAGLIERAGGTEEAELLGYLLAASDHRTFRDSYPKEPTREQRVRRLGAAVMRFGLVERTEKSFEQAVATAYGPFSRDRSAQLLRGLPANTETLLLAPIPDHNDRVAWLWRSEGDDATLGIASLGEKASVLLEQLSKGRWSGELRGTALAPLRTVIPEMLRARLAKVDRPLLLLPLDRLWSVPWPAVPLDDGRFLGEVVPLALSPSLSVHAALLTQTAADRRTPRPVVAWRSPAIGHHDLDPVFVDDPTWQRRPITESWQLKEALLRNDPGDPLIVIACHGYPIGGLGHYLELAPGEPLTPTELLNASRTPREVVLISCWGATTPDAPAGESLTIAMLALTRGSQRVAASIAELGDSLAATHFIQAFLHRMRDRPMPLALRDATIRLLEQPGVREGPLRDWSPLVIIGTL
jgi:tetratricopeptide (TPR) repeat protein